MKFEIPHELSTAISEKKLVIFIGAGISIKEGLPSWKKIVLKTLKKHDSVIKNASNIYQALESDVIEPLEALDKIKDSKRYVYELFEKELSIKNIDSKFIQNLSKLSSKFITTNFDSLIEHSLPELIKITKDSSYNLAKVDKDNPYLLKIHGDVESIDHCVIFSDQYNSLYSNDHLATFQLKKIFSQYTVLFLGFSFSDPYVKELFDHISTLLDGYGPKHFIISTEHIDQKNLTSISIDNHSDLDCYIDELESIVSAEKKVQTNKVIDTIKPKRINIDGSDIPPSITHWVGRKEEITSFENKYKVFFITGIGGQGKSALAAYYLEKMKASGNYQFGDWRDFKEEDHKFQNKIISMIILVKDDATSKVQEYLGYSNKELVDHFFDVLAEKSGIFILDNVDRYIDLEKLKPFGDIEYLYEQAIARNHNSKFIFTCRPFIKLAGLNFSQLALTGLTEEDVIVYFKESQLPINENKLIEYAKDSYNLTQGHPLWISLIVAQGNRGEKDLVSFLSSIHKKDLNTDNPSSIMSQSILGKIWGSLNEKHKLVLRTLAESVQSITIEEFSEIVSGELTYQRFIRSFNAIKNLGLIIEKSGGEFVELHPLVREYIKSRFHKNERTKFIYMFINFYGKVVLLLQSNDNTTYNLKDFYNWTNQIELYANAGEYQKALDAMNEIHSPIKRAGYIEEYIRVASIVFKGIVWEKHKLMELTNFDDIYLDTMKSSTEYGDTQLTSFLLESYNSTVVNKDPSYITISEARAYHAWFNGKYDEAIEICEKATFLLESASQPENSSLKHVYALALRDTKKIDNMEKSLNIFLSGEDIKIVADKSSINDSLGGAFYGNVGRCLSFMERGEKSINCLCKSFSIISKGKFSDRTINLGYASQWLSEVISDNEEAKYYFQKLSLNLWENNSPPLFNQHKAIYKSKDSKFLFISKIESWKVEKFCNEWVQQRIIKGHTHQMDSHNFI